MSVLTATASDRAANELWWVGMLGAVLTLFFGIIAVFWPGLTLTVLLYLFGAFILGLGIVEAIGGFMGRRTRGSWWVTVLLGLIGIGVGIYLLRHPGVTLTTFIVIIGIALIVRGLLGIIGIFVERSPATDKILGAIIGIVSLIAGIIILFQPVAGGVAFVWILGVYAIISGITGIALALELRSRLLAAENLVTDTAETAPARNHGGRAGTSKSTKA